MILAFRITAMSAAFFLLTACGLKGPLYLPPPEAAEKQPVPEQKPQPEKAQAAGKAEPKDTAKPEKPAQPGASPDIMFPKDDTASDY